MTKVEQCHAALDEYRARASRGGLIHGMYEGILLERALWDAQQAEATAYAAQTHQPYQPKDAA